jgi:hypothetical protein
MRIETDFIGAIELPDDFPFGIHTFRAMRNFAFGPERIRGDLFGALVDSSPSGRRRHIHQHGGQRVDRQPGPETDGETVRGLRNDFAAGDRKPLPIHQRHLSDGGADRRHPQVEKTAPQRRNPPGSAAGQGKGIRLDPENRPDRASGRHAAFAGGWTRPATG